MKKKCFFFNFLVLKHVFLRFLDIKSDILNMGGQNH